MLKLREADPVAVQAVVAAMIIAHGRTRKGRRTVELALHMLRTSTLPSVVPMARVARLHAHMDEAAMLLEGLLDCIDGTG